MIVETGHFSPEVIMQSGQCFRMRKTGDSDYEVIAFKQLLRIRQISKNRFDFDCDTREFDRIWREYFDLERDYSQILDFIDKKDSYLRQAVLFGDGMKILKQNPFEMLISFITSQRKSIPAIRKCISALCEVAGEHIGTSPYDSAKLFTFPTAKALSSLSEEELNRCMLGYRSKYIMSVSKAVADRSPDLESLKNLSSEALIEELTGFYGVGIKVASCIALFGYYRTEVFPVDVWIKRILDREYRGVFPPENCKNPDQYQNIAGILQQYMFYYERFRV